MRAVLGHSDDPTTSAAVAAAIGAAERALGGEAPKAALLFCSADYDLDEVLGAIQARWPGLPLVGSTTDGEFSTALGFCDDSIALTLFAGDDLRVHAGLGRDLSQGIDGAVASAVAGAEELRPRLCLTTFAPSTNSSEVLRSLSARLGDTRCPVIGGLSGDHREYSRMREFFGGEVLQDSLPLLLLEADVELGWGVGSGWSPVGEAHVVTRSDGHVVYEIDGRPAVEMYREHYGVVPQHSLGEYPLAVYDEGGRWALRAVLEHVEADGSLRFAGEIQEGSSVRNTEVLSEGILRGSGEALEAALEAFTGDRPELALVFSCAARKWVLGTGASEEIEVLRRIAADRGLADLAMVGMYCFGEIAPHGVDARNGFHNETCVTAVLGG